MRDSWKGKNVNLSVLSERIACFFESKKFATSLQRKNSEFIIVAAPQSFHGISEKIIVSISGNPDDFSINFIGGSRSRSLILHGSFLSLIGGGFFVLKGLKSLEEIEKLEEQFWIYVDQLIWYLTNST